MNSKEVFSPPQQGAADVGFYPETEDNTVETITDDDWPISTNTTLKAAAVGRSEWTTLINWRNMELFRLFWGCVIAFGKWNLPDQWHRSCWQRRGHISIETCLHWFISYYKIIHANRFPDITSCLFFTLSIDHVVIRLVVLWICIFTHFSNKAIVTGW